MRFWYCAFKSKMHAYMHATRLWWSVFGIKWFSYCVFAAFNPSILKPWKTLIRFETTPQPSFAQQDGVLHAHALLVWGKCSRRLSELHTGFTNFSFFRYFSHGSTWEYTGVLFKSFLIASDGKEKMWASADHCKPSDFCVMSGRTRRQYGGLLCVRVQI